MFNTCKNGQFQKYVSKNYSEVCGIYIDIIVSKNFLLDILRAQSCEHNSCNLHPQVITNFMLISFQDFQIVLFNKFIFFALLNNVRSNDKVEQVTSFYQFYTILASSHLY